jgi:phenylacetyl-CoA:acceptor oxidoreductase subunit 2
MKAERQILDRVPPRQQTEWDIRGALNFVCGGAGGGLLAAVALAAPLGLDLRPLIALGLALIGAGLFSVWLKIGRPWRALNVFRRPSTSWMTREAMIGGATFACGALAIFARAPLAIWALGALGLVYAYAQARILKENIGIPAWRRWSCVVLVVVTALVEGVGLLAAAAPVWPALAPAGYLLALLLLWRFGAWRYYRDDLAAVGAPKGTAAAFDALETRFVVFGHGAAGALALAGSYLAQPLLLAAAGVLAVGAGAMFKYVLVCRAAFTQGFALPRAPSRGKGRPGVGAQPGWQPGRGP